MKLFLVRLVVVLALCWLAPPVVADVIAKGQSIEEVEMAMKKAGYGPTELAVMPMTGEDLRFWAIDEDGTLIIHFDPSTRKITKMRYWLTEERPKAEREQFRLEVVAFDTESGVMTIQTKKKPAGKPAPQKG